MWLHAHWQPSRNRGLKADPMPSDILDLTPLLALGNFMLRHHGSKR